MTAFKRYKSLLWLLAGWLFIAPLLGAQHFYSTHSPLANDVCDTCLLSSSGGQALTPHLVTVPIVAPLQQYIVLTVLPPQHRSVWRANARAPPIA